MYPTVDEKGQSQPFQQQPQAPYPAAPPAYGYGYEPGYPPQQQPPPQKQVLIQPTAPVSTVVYAPTKSATGHLVFAIFVCLCCCCPLGLPAIICASNAGTAYGAGRVPEGDTKAKTSLILSIVGLVLGILIIAGFLLIYFVFLTSLLGIASSVGDIGGCWYPGASYGQSSDFSDWDCTKCSTDAYLDYSEEQTCCDCCTVNRYVSDCY